MSGSYYNLLSKYNTLYALYLKLQNAPGVTQDLSGVLNAGNTANNDIILTDTTFSNTMNKEYILLETNASFANPTPELYVEALINDPLSAKFALSSIYSYVDVGNNFFANLLLQNDTSNLAASSSSIDISGVGLIHIDSEKIEFNSLKGLYSIADDLTLACPAVIDISMAGLTLNGDAGDLGEILISNGAGIAPTWSGIENVICNGSVATPGVSGTVLFSTFSASFSYAPVVILTIVSGDTTTYIANVIAVTSTQFTYTISGLNSAFLNFIAI